MLLKNNIVQKFIICSLMIIFAQTSVNGQSTQPKWWFGVSGGGNLNFYDGTTQRLNNSLFVPTTFHKGIGLRPYGSLLMEYRPGRIWGLMMNFSYDDRGAKFKDVIAPCNCPATLKTQINYLDFEPSLRIGSATSNFFFFAGPRVAFNLEKDFSYTQLKQPDTDGELSSIRKSLFSGQVGFGYDFQIRAPYASTKTNISPFVSFHPYFGQGPRDIESLSIATLRAGIAFKIGRGSKESFPQQTPEPLIVPPIQAPIAAIITPSRDVAFSVREPKAVMTLQVSETLPLRNSVFFDEGSAEIPSRYIMLTKNQAFDFKEESLQNEQSGNMVGRSARQMNVYHNILNILGDRLRSNPGASISFSGASRKGPKEGKAFADAIKQYMVNIFGIDGSRINTLGRTKPLIPSEKPGGTRELALLRAGDRRVDIEIESSSPELLMEVGGGLMKPVQILSTQLDPLDSHVIFNVAGAQEVLKSWSINVTDSRGTIQQYGPFTRDRESVPGKTILGDLAEGNYNVSMLGETKTGEFIRKESTIRLLRQNDATQKGFRYSILFDFDKANAIASYEKFLLATVLPSISEGSIVRIHGHTDIIGENNHNLTLSQNRAQQTQQILQRALSTSGRNNVRFQTQGFGEDLNNAPFENNLPEERFYNRTVIIDIIPK